MLEISAVDLGTLAEALEDHSADHSWWFDPRSGRVELTTDAADDPDDFDSDQLIPVEPTPARVTARDMEDFIDRVRDPGARRILERTVGDPRDFRAGVCEFPALRDAWFTFVEVRRQRRAIQWLADEGVVSGSAAKRELAGRPEPDTRATRRSADGHEIARQVCEDLRPLYGDRLRDVVLVGSRARGEAHPESDVDLLVVLDEVESVWDELATMDDALWRHSYDYDVVVTAVPVGEQDLRQFKLPAVVRARDTAGAATATWVDGASSPGLPRSREELEAAGLLAKHGFARAAVSRAYLAALFAAEDALLALGASRAKHARVVAMFGKLVVRDGGMDAGVARVLRSLYERRDAADEARVPVPEHEAHRAVDDADQVVVAVESWLGTRQS
jgi:uncharacterized protein (UPF0332 family)/predicted nucleotidyltransferase